MNTIKIDNFIAPHKRSITVRQKIVDSFYKFGEQQGYLFLPKISGLLSTTFSHPVFSMPHLKKSIGIHGLHSAFRPTDNDEGSHLVTFGQYYICTNSPIANQFDFICKFITSAVQEVLSPYFNDFQISFSENGYEWHADSTGYKGGGGEINVSSITVNKKTFITECLEIAQINDYSISGGIQGNACHLIVIGIDRLVNLCSIIKEITLMGTNIDLSHIPFEDFYEISAEDASLYRGLADVFQTTPPDSQKLITNIEADILNIAFNLEKKKFDLGIYNQLGQISSLAECAYASNAITRDFRVYLIKKINRLYKIYASDIANNPDTHLQHIYSLFEPKVEIPITVPSIQDVLTQTSLDDYFKIVPRHIEHPNYEHLITKELASYFREENTKTLTENHTSHLKWKMFCRAIGRDLIQPIENLANSSMNVRTLSGSISERIERIYSLIKFLDSEKMLENINIDKLKIQKNIKYLTVEWQYRSPKIYPKLEGKISTIAMRQQGYDEQLIACVNAFHTTGSKLTFCSPDIETSLLILVGKLDESITLFIRSIENGRSISNMDPFGVKQLISTVVSAAKALNLNLNNIQKLITYNVSINLSAFADETLVLDGYFWQRIKNEFNH